MQRRAMSLIEIMVAMTILSLVLAGGFGAMLSGHTATLTTAGEASMLRACESLIEQIQSTHWADIAAGNGPQRMSAAQSGLDPVDPGTDPVRVTYDQVEPGVVRVVITGQWLDRTGPRTMRVTYFHVNRGG